MKVVVIGAGLAGLVCGRTLLRAGHEAVVLEASDGVGGRVRSDTVDGFVLERGFQVLLTAYPAARRQLDYDRLDLRVFDPGVLISQAARRHTLSDPLRDTAALLPSLTTRIVTAADKLKAGALAAEILRKSVDEIMAGPDETTESFLRGRGFSEKFIDNFVRRFFGGVFLDDRLQTSAKAFQFDLKMMGTGDTAVPAGGMGKISAQIAEELAAAGCVRRNARVDALLRDGGGRVVGARLEDGAAVTGAAVVVATPAPEAARLTGLPMPEGKNGSMALYFAGPVPLYKEKKIVLNANHNPFINDLVQVTNIAPEHAPPGRHLLSTTVLGVPDGSDDALYARALRDLKRVFAGDPAAEAALKEYRPLALYRIPYGQFPQPPGIYAALPDNDTGQPGLFLAGEFTHASSQNAAMVSGEKAARRLLETAV